MFIQGTDTVRVDWSPVPPQYTNGVLLGYKVLYSDVNDRSRVNSSLISPNKTYLNIKGLKTNTNYSFQVLAFTAKGNGVRSAAYYARTSSGILKLGTFSLCCYIHICLVVDLTALTTAVIIRCSCRCSTQLYSFQTSVEF